MDEVFLQFSAPLFWHRYGLLCLEIEGYHHGATLRKALIATHDALVKSHALVAQTRHICHYNDIISKAYLAEVVGMCRGGDDA